MTEGGGFFARATILEFELPLLPSGESVTGVRLSLWDGEGDFDPAVSAQIGWLTGDVPMMRKITYLDIAPPGFAGGENNFDAIDQGTQQINYDAGKVQFASNANSDEDRMDFSLPGAKTRSPDPHIPYQELHVTTGCKRRIAFGIVLALWIPFHHVATRFSGADPWKFFGWARYAVPNATVTVRANPMRGQERVPRLLSPASLALLEAYVRRRAVWGRLASPEAMADQVLEHESDLDGLEVITRDLRVDTADARWTFDEQVQVFHR